jgi:hypothetical protein
MSRRIEIFIISVAILASALLSIKIFEAAGSMGKFHQDAIFPQMVETACLSYLTEYDQLPPSSDNQKLTSALLGDNPRKIVFISLSKRQLNADHEMVDGWGTPIKITFYSLPGNVSPRVLVQSAGPDKIFGTADDITNQ